MTFVQFMLLNFTALLLVEALLWIRLLRRRVHGSERRRELVAAVCGLFVIPVVAYAVYLMLDYPYITTLSSPLLLCVFPLIAFLLIACVVTLIREGYAAVRHARSPR
jgi:hypothetical protein